MSDIYTYFFLETVVQQSFHLDHDSDDDLNSNSPKIINQIDKNVKITQANKIKSKNSTNDFHTSDLTWNQDSISVFNDEMKKKKVVDESIAMLYSSGWDLQSTDGSIN